MSAKSTITISRIQGRELPEPVEMSSDEYYQAIDYIEQANKHQQANAPRSSNPSWQEVIIAKDRVESILAAHRSPIRFEATAEGGDIYLASAETAAISPQIAAEIEITTGAHQVLTTNYYGTGIVLKFGDCP